MDSSSGGGETGPGTFAELEHMDRRRKALLTMARKHSPLSSALNVRLLPQTVIPRLMCRYMTWVTLVTFAGSAVLARMGYTEQEIDPNGFDGAGTMVTFMIIFYVGYCYTRYGDQFKLIQVAVRAIISCCALAATSFKDKEEVVRIYRYTTMLHVASYTGLSTTYSQHNFFVPICEKYGLYGAPGSREREQEQETLGSVDIDQTGAQTMQMLMKWALEVVERQAAAGEISPPVHAQFNKLILDLGDATGNLFAFSYQVLPFIYTQLVALSCAGYLVSSAFLKGLNFIPGQSYTFGLIVPALNIGVTTLTIFGLLEVGDTIMDPFGGDPEDYAVLHFVEHCAVASREAIDGKSAPVPLRVAKPQIKSNPITSPSASATTTAKSTEPLDPITSPAASAKTTAKSTEPLISAFPTNYSPGSAQQQQLDQDYQMRPGKAPSPSARFQQGKSGSGAGGGGVGRKGRHSTREHPGRTRRSDKRKHPRAGSPGDSEGSPVLSSDHDDDELVKIASSGTCEGTRRQSSTGSPSLRATTTTPSSNHETRSMTDNSHMRPRTPLRAQAEASLSQLRVERKNRPEASSPQPLTSQHLAMLRTASQRAALDA